MKHSPKKSRRRRGFTLVELLIVVFIISILMNVALPFYLASAADAAKKTCRANMQSICNAAVAWKTKNRAYSFTGLTPAALNGDLGNLPLCPSGGTYTISYSGNVTDATGATQTIPTGGIGITCSASQHYGYIPGVMSQ